MRTELYWIPGPWKGRLAIMPRPRGGDWLEEEMRAWRTAGVQTVVSALEPDEITELDLEHEGDRAKVEGIDLIAFPIPDRSIPDSAQATAELVKLLEGQLAQGRQIAIHCRQGVGRSALLAACVLRLGGLDTEAAFARISAARGCSVPDTSEQRLWVARAYP